MRIYIDWIDAAAITQGGDTGYRIRFRSELGCGTALLAVSDSVSPALLGQEIFVEIEAQSFRDVRVLLPEEPHHYHFEALPEEGNYEAVGEVLRVMTEAGAGFAITDVCVGEALFHWTPEDIGEDIFVPGDWVRFTVIGLVLWDKNL
jgi:hypothetical protein